MPIYLVVELKWCLKVYPNAQFSCEKSKLSLARSTAHQDSLLGTETLAFPGATLPRSHNRKLLDSRFFKPNQKFLPPPLCIHADSCRELLYGIIFRYTATNNKFSIKSMVIKQSLYVCNVSKVIISIVNPFMYLERSLGKVSEARTKWFKKLS